MIFPLGIVDYDLVRSPRHTVGTASAKARLWIQHAIRVGIVKGLMFAGMAWAIVTWTTVDHDRHSIVVGYVAARPSHAVEGELSGRIML